MIVLKLLLWTALTPAGAGVDFSAELARLSRLRLEGYPPPYYLSLTATEVTAFERRCAMGAPLSESTHRQTVVVPDLRVGSRELDNHPQGGPGASASRAVPLEDDFAARHALWRMLDGAYKSASAAFLRRQAQRVSRGKADYETDDLSAEPPRRALGERPARIFSPEVLRELCARGSAVFRANPSLLSAQADVSWQSSWSRLRDSEGSAVDFGREIAEVELSAVTIASDGLKIPASRTFLAVAPDGLPDAAALEREARGMLAELESLRVASTTSPFSGPALLDPSVSAALVLAMGLRLTGEEQRNPGGAQTFRGKLGKRVLPSMLTLVDDPSLRRFGAEPLIGGYAHDEQGVPGKRVVLVESGSLKGFLLSRYPVVGFSRSNGHGRAAPGFLPAGMPSNLVLSSSRALPEEKLVSLLREEARRRGKRYGIWIRSLRQFSQKQAAAGQDSIRLTGFINLVEAETGKMAVVRDLDLVGTPLVLLGNILYPGDRPEVRNFLNGGVPVSVVSPSLLLTDAELQRSEAKPENLPILPPPAP